MLRPPLLRVPLPGLSVDRLPLVMRVTLLKPPLSSSNKSESSLTTSGGLLSSRELLG